jgi:leucyl aminopeptidase
MPNIDISFTRSAKPTDGLAVLLAAAGAKFGAAADQADPANVIDKAVKVSKFTGKALSTLDLLAPSGSAFDRIVGVGVGEASAVNAQNWLKLGGTIQSQLKKSDKVTVYLDAPGFEIGGKEAAELALGFILRAYRFDKYRTKKDDADNGEEPAKVKVTIVTAAATAAKKAFADAEAVAGGVMLARDLVNEPANMLGPVEFAARAKELEALGVKVEVLTEKEMKKLGMGALLGVAQGSARPPRLVVMQWNGGKPKDKADPKKEGGTGQYASPAPGSQVQAALVKELKRAYRQMPKKMKQQYDDAVAAAKEQYPSAWISELDFKKRAGR